MSIGIDGLDDLALHLVSVRSRPPLESKIVGAIGAGNSSENEHRGAVAGAKALR
jgi:hypothetical protein